MAYCFAVAAAACSIGVIAASRCDVVSLLQALLYSFIKYGTETRGLAQSSAQRCEGSER